MTPTTNLVRGRPFASDDGAPGREVAIVNQRLASQFFASDDPIGQRIQLVADTPGTGPPQWLTIVGVSPTVRQRNTREADPDAVVYVPYRFAPDAAITLMVRSDREPASMARTVRDEVRSLDSALPVFGVATLNDLLAQFRWPYRVFGSMFAAFAVFALVLSTLALYATTAHSVAQRTREIGVRMALGAAPRQVRWLILRTTLIRLAIGLTLGMAGAIGVGRLLRTLLAQASPTDPLTLGAVAATFLVVAIVAAYRPARSATAIDPVAALRWE